MLLLSIYDNNNLGRNLLLLHYINIYNAYNIANKECVDIEVEFIYFFFQSIIYLIYYRNIVNNYLIYFNTH